MAVKCNYLFLFFIFLYMPVLCSAGQLLVSHKVREDPVVDGRVHDEQWQGIKPLVTHDGLAGIDIRIRSVYTDEFLSILVEFPDPDESRDHRLWHWNEDTQMYREGPEREDVFVLKWAMDAGVDDLTLEADLPYNADIWYWKACRTDSQGYADDKIQRYTNREGKKMQQLTSRSGEPMFLKREGDAGESAYKSEILVDRQDDVMPRYTTRKPSGSRADVVARGVWAEGGWVVEFSRALTTGAGDDLQFIPGAGPYLFGVSRYEIAGRKPNLEIEQPMFGSGEITEHLRLKFAQ